MTLNEFCDILANGKSKVIAEGGEPDSIYVHPDKCRELGLIGGEVIHGLTVRCPSWEQLGLLGSMSGVDPKSAAMWDPENVFILRESRVTEKDTKQ